MRKGYSRLARGIIFAVLSLIFLLGAVLATMSFTWYRNIVYNQYDNHLSELANTIDLNINNALPRLSDAERYDSFFSDPESFFSAVVPETMYEDYWIVLYDAGTGLTIYNKGIQPSSKVLTVDEILARDDGCTVMYRQYETGESGAQEYIFTEEDGSEKAVRIYVIPSSVSRNGLFTVAVSVYNQQVAFPLIQMISLGLISAALMAFSAAAALFMMLHSGRREREMSAELASLEREKQLNEELAKQLQDIVHHQKLETIGTLTAGISHEFNNLMSPIMGNSLLILEKARTSDQEIFDNALEIYEASSKAKNLVKDISKLSRRQSSSGMAALQPEKLVDYALSMSASSIPENVTARKTINSSELILGDEIQLGHMLLNLVINAIQAMEPDGGVLSLSVYDDGNKVFITVSDTGKGIPDDILKSIFDPFFTTKEVGKGTGLGLAIAQRTAMNHNGSITVEKIPEGGTRFCFSVPVYRQQ